MSDITQNQTVRANAFLGGNVVMLNEATMMSIVQEWFNREMAAPPRVVSVAAEDYQASSWFKISIAANLS